jgi:hypothetical protein
MCSTVLQVLRANNVQYCTAGAGDKELKPSRDLGILQVNRLDMVYVNVSLIGMNVFYKNWLERA